MSTIKITGLTSSGAIVGNVILPMVGNVAGTLTTLRGTVDQLKTFIVAGAEANILAANSATIFANTVMKGYVDLANTIQSAQLTSANIGIIGYVDLANTIQSAQIASANLGMKGYVDSVASQSIYGNANVTSYTVSMGFTNYSNVNTKAYAESMGYQNFSNVNVAAYVTTANSAVIGYVDNKVSTANIGMIGLVNLVIATANIANAVVTQSVVSANLGMKGYVDSVATLSSYGNGNVKSYLTSGFDGNILPSANVTYSLGSSTNQWKDLWVSGNTINIGGVALSISGNTLVVNGQAQSALYDLITSNVFLQDLPGGYGNVTLNNTTRQVLFERSSFGASDFTQFKYTLDGTDPATSGTAISLFLPELATQRINVAGNLTLKTTFVGGNSGSNAEWYIYQYR